MHETSKSVDDIKLFEKPHDASMLMSSGRTPELSERAKGGRWVTM